MNGVQHAIYHDQHLEAEEPLQRVTITQEEETTRFKLKTTAPLLESNRGERLTLAR